MAVFFEVVIAHQSVNGVHFTLSSNGRPFTVAHHSHLPFSPLSGRVNKGTRCRAMIPLVRVIFGNLRDPGRASHVGGRTDCSWAGTRHQ